MTIASTQGHAQVPAGARTTDSKCSGLTGVKIESGLVEGAERLAKGETIAGGETGGAKVTSDVCRVRLRLSPVAGSQIKVEVWLPPNWNGKLYGLGGGGFDGGLNPGGAALLGEMAGQGYAVVATDAGHKPTPDFILKEWAHQQPERVVDFGHRATHLGAVVAKQVTAAYYGEPAKRSYFYGCSNGGRDGLMEASRYPEDYDAIISGSPAVRYTEVVTQIAANMGVFTGPGGKSLSAKRELVHAAILKKCDGLDGLNDGLLENPRVCRFDPGELQCRGAEAATCLTDAEVKAFRRIYRGPQLRNGELVTHGPSLGAEGIASEWDGWLTNVATGNVIGQQFYGWIVHDDPNWKFADFDLDKDYPVARSRAAPIIDVKPDLRAFTARGGKLIISTGWGDPGITAEDVLGYYETAQKQLGPKAGSQVRLFMVPGMGHCLGGPGPWAFDMRPVLENWVERGEIPQRVVATHPGTAEETFTRPLCAWPMTARYNGSGSTKDAANFICKAPKR